MSYPGSIDYVDLFAGAGGWDVALASFGLSGVGIDADLYACQTALAAGHARLCGDVQDFRTHWVDGFSGVRGLVASPPCQSFSQAGRRGGLDDPRGQLVFEPVRWVADLLPEWCAFEQVPGVLPIWRLEARKLEALGYYTWAGILCAADYGVPQTRRRAILIASRVRPVAAPAVTHPKGRWVSMAEALGWPASDRYLSSGQERPIGPLTGQAPTLASGNDAASWCRVRPATTVQGTPRIAQPGHHEQQFRDAIRVTLPELGVLQGFPADYPWKGTKTQVARQIGNAIPPAMAAAILREATGATAEEAA